MLLHAPRALHGGRDTEQQATQQRHAEGEAEHGRVGAHGVEQRQVARRERDQCARADRRECQPHRPTA